MTNSNCKLISFTRSVNVVKYLYSNSLKYFYVLYILCTVLIESIFLSNRICFINSTVLSNIKYNYIFLLLLHFYKNIKAIIKHAEIHNSFHKKKKFLIHVICIIENVDIKKM
jgi:hypothetical protein